MVGRDDRNASSGSRLIIQSQYIESAGMVTALIAGADASVEAAGLAPPN